VKTLGSAASVVAAIRDDAAAEVERIEREATEAIARFAAEEAAEGPPIADAEVRRAAARREAAELLAGEDLLDARAALDASEAWLARAVAAGRERLDEPAPPDERRARLARLAREGLDRIPGEPIELVLAPADRALVDEAWARAVAGGRAARLVPDEAIAPGGLRVRGGDGRVSFDDTLEARARRFEAAWRAELAALWSGA